MKIRVPITIFSDVEKSDICNGVVLRKITDEELHELFGIETRELDSNFNLLGYVPIKYSNPTEEGLFQIGDIVMHILGDYLFPFLSNYIIEIDTDDSESLVKRLSFALKLNGFSKTGISMYFNQKRATSFVYPNPYCKLGPYLTLNKFDLKGLSNQLDLIKDNEKDDKFLLIMEKYLNCVSGYKTSNENRFLEMIIILEMILLPKMNDELSYRFSLRGSKLLYMFTGENRKESFDFLKKIYNIRSKLAHEGKSTMLDKQLLFKCQETTSLFIKKYIENKELFSNEKLEEICID